MDSHNLVDSHILTYKLILTRLASVSVRALISTCGVCWTAGPSSIGVRPVAGDWRVDDGLFVSISSHRTRSFQHFNHTGKEFTKFHIIIRIINF